MITFVVPAQRLLVANRSVHHAGHVDGEGFHLIWLRPGVAGDVRSGCKNVGRVSTSANGAVGREAETDTDDDKTEYDSLLYTRRDVRIWVVDSVK